VTFTILIGSSSSPNPCLKACGTIAVLRCLLLTGLIIGAPPVAASAQTTGQPSLRGAITGLARNSSGALSADLYLTYSGTGFAKDVRIDQLQLRTLSGTGTVMYNSPLSPSLPLIVGNLTTGETTTVRLYFSVPETVVRFSITENGTVQNAAGMTLNFSIAQSVVVPVSVPTITASVSSEPNAAGWYKTDVRVTFTCSDASGNVTCPAPVQVTAEGTNQVSGTAVNSAGRTATTTVTIKLDKTPPSLLITSPENGAILAASPASLTGTATDALSGLATIMCNGAPVPAAPFSCSPTLNRGPNVLSAEAADLAGNQTIVTVNVSLTPTYYVNALTGDDSNAGSLSAPWKTIQQAANTIEAGATVYIAAGSYDERVQVGRSGSLGLPMTLQARGAVVTKGFSITGSFVRIVGFEIANTTANGPGCDQAAIHSSGQSNEIRYNNIHDVAAWGICLEKSSSFNIVSSNLIVHAGGMGIWAHGKDHLVEGNDISRTVQYHAGWTNIPSWIDADGIHIDGVRTVVRKNIIHDIRITDPENGDPHIDCFQVAQNDQAIDVTIEQNTCSIPQMGAPRCFQASMIEGEGGVQNLIIRNNVVHDMCRGFTVNGTMGSQMGVHILNNTFYNLQEFGIIACNAPAIEVKNNIFHSINTPYFTNVAICGTISPQDPTSNVGNNLAYLTGGSSHPNDIWGVDPRFVDPANGNYHLQSGSPAIDAGITHPMVTLDFDFLVRPVGPATDIGAFEYSPNNWCSWRR